MNTTAPLPSRIGSCDHRRESSHSHSHSKMAEPTSQSQQDSTSASALVCPICRRQLNNPHILPCLHAFCLRCLRDECEGKSADKFFCPLCVVDDADGAAKKSYHSRVWHSFDRILEQESGSKELQRRLAELPAREEEEGGEEENTAEEEPWEKEEEEDNESPDTGESSADSNRKSSSMLQSPVLFPCSMHADRMADTFCQKCDQLACHKCVSSFHRRCQNFSGLREAVDTKRRQFDSVHDKMAANLVACEDVVNFQQKRLQEIEAMRTEILVQIKKFRTDIVSIVLAKEKALTQEANQLLDELKGEATEKNVAAGRLANSLQKQMELLDLSFSVGGEAELLPILPGIPARIDNDLKTIGKQHSDALPRVTFIPDQECKTVVDASLLGRIQVGEGLMMKSFATDPPEIGSDMTEVARPDLNLALVTSFHGGTRDDVTEPLLTDLIVIANGDIILTDRDNKCVKKFNQTGKLLTRVLLDAVPSRIATVSHARAVVSVMNKKLLYFLSLFGTVRVLHTVRVKKLYSFLTSLGNGLLAAGTNLCESIDVINEKGEMVRSIFTQKSEKASISRPLYLTPVIPRSSIILSAKNDNALACNNNNNSVNNNGAHNESESNSRRASLNNSHNNVNINNNNGAHNESNSRRASLNSLNQTNASKASTSKKSSKVKTSTTKKSSASSPTTTTDITQSPSSSSSSSLSSSSSTSSNSDQGILVSDSGKRVIFRLQPEGSVTFSLRNSDQVRLECPLGVTVHDKGLTLLADRDADCVLLLDKDGKFLKKVLSREEDGLAKPCGIYAGMKGSVTLSQVDGTIKIYKTVY